MVWWWLALAGLFGGLCGGMGMGGGTLLIPILTMFLGIDQHLAQGLNLLVFIPTGIIAVIIHMKNKLIDYKVFFIIILPAIATAVCAALFVGKIKSETLSLCFGIFLILIGLFEMYNAIKTSINNKKKKPVIKNKVYFKNMYKTNVTLKFYSKK
ncbi:MAG: sulfite exporter TauE/SafE family protein [Clostridia bacterium]|nr:sulfite exporter TauE/SafE family protein [Clostridia bacterium]